MKKWESYWKRFEKTGDIRDYLNYTACTKENEDERSLYADAVEGQSGVPNMLCEGVRTGEANPATGTEKSYFAVLQESAQM